jgi:hypothetical protein
MAFFIAQFADASKPLSRRQAMKSFDVLGKVAMKNAILVPALARLRAF